MASEDEDTAAAEAITQRRIIQFVQRFGRCNDYKPESRSSDIGRGRRWCRGTVALYLYAGMWKICFLFVSYGEDSDYQSTYVRQERDRE